MPFETYFSSLCGRSQRPSADSSIVTRSELNTSRVPVPSLVGTSRSLGTFLSAATQTCARMYLCAAWISFGVSLVSSVGRPRLL